MDPKSGSGYLNGIDTKKSDLTIILPLYNPHKGWESEITASLDKLNEKFSDVDFCITVVNDGSRIEIEDILKNNILPFYGNLNYLGYRDNMGKGFAVRHGLKHSRSDYYIYCDFDFPFGIDALRRIFDILSEGKKNLIISSRKLSSVKNLPLKRRIISSALMLINLILTRFRIKDTQAGLKGFDNKAKDIFLAVKTNSYIFDLEFILRCLKEDLQYTTLPVLLNNNIKFTNFSSGTINREIITLFKILFVCK